MVRVLSLPVSSAVSARVCVYVCRSSQVLLGELDKYVAVSPQRFVSISAAISNTVADASTLGYPHILLSLTPPV